MIRASVLQGRISI